MTDFAIDSPTKSCGVFAEAIRSNVELIYASNLAFCCGIFRIYATGYSSAPDFHIDVLNLEDACKRIQVSGRRRLVYQATGTLGQPLDSRLR